MPKNVATPAQSAQAQAEVGGAGAGFHGPSGIRVGAEVASNRVAGVRPLRQSDKRLLTSGEPSIYIYNVSPIFQWNANAGGRSFGVIPKCKPPAKVSVALEVPGVLVSSYDAGNRFRNTYTEIGIDIAEDILSCSKEMPGLPQNDLTNYGCFYLIGKKFDEHTEKEQQAILSDALAKHEDKCRLKVLEADQWADSEIQRRWITEVYRQCALYLQVECDDKSIGERRWVTSRGAKKAAVVVECRWCGWECKPNIAICPNCKNVIDEKMYNALRNETKAPKSPEA